VSRLANDFYDRCLMEKTPVITGYSNLHLTILMPPILDPSPLEGEGMKWPPPLPSSPLVGEDRGGGSATRLERLIDDLLQATQPRVYIRPEMDP
jgi:hypothetical protein